jgi:hypothetical protein
MMQVTQQYETRRVVIPLEERTIFRSTRDSQYRMGLNTLIGRFGQGCTGAELRKFIKDLDELLTSFGD